jgi:hypothetical protein
MAADRRALSGCNPLGIEPAIASASGCVYELVPNNARIRLLRGGPFSRRDGMHFELARAG